MTQILLCTILFNCILDFWFCTKAPVRSNWSKVGVSFLLYFCSLWEKSNSVIVLFNTSAGFHAANAKWTSEKHKTGPLGSKQIGLHLLLLLFLYFVLVKHGFKYFSFYLSFFTFPTCFSPASSPKIKDQWSLVIVLLPFKPTFQCCIWVLSRYGIWPPSP